MKKPHRASAFAPAKKNQWENTGTARKDLVHSIRQDLNAGTARKRVGWVGMCTGGNHG